PYETAVGDAEILTEVRVSIRPGSGSAYEKLERRAGDWPIAAAGTFVQVEGDAITDVGIGITAVGAAHFTCVAAEEQLRGGPASAAAIGQAAVICAQSCNPSADQRGPQDYKRHLVGVLVGRALARSIARAKGEVT
ncbi:MAG: FAD binding domain-containing protein, partial [Acidimicrobiales bacterium]